jgi:hypothetical protein
MLGKCWANFENDPPIVSKGTVPPVLGMIRHLVYQGVALGRQGVSAVLPSTSIV